MQWFDNTNKYGKSEVILVWSNRLSRQKEEHQKTSASSGSHTMVNSGHRRTRSKTKNQLMQLLVNGSQVSIENNGTKEARETASQSDNGSRITYDKSFS